MTTTRPVFRIFAYNDDNRVLSLATEDLPNAPEGLEVATAGEVLRITRETETGWLLDYDSETYSLEPITKFCVFHPYGGQPEWIQV